MTIHRVRRYMEDAVPVWVRQLAAGGLFLRAVISPCRHSLGYSVVAKAPPLLGGTSRAVCLHAEIENTMCMSLGMLLARHVARIRLNGPPVQMTYCSRG